MGHAQGEHNLGVSPTIRGVRGPAVITLAGWRNHPRPCVWPSLLVSAQWGEYKDKPSRRALYFSTETLKAKRAWKDVFQVLKQCNCQPRLLYPSKISLITEGEIKTFHEKPI
jgi:hypothetical protein